MMWLAYLCTYVGAATLAWCFIQIVKKLEGEQ
jgi:hypothetical protein